MLPSCRIVSGAVCGHVCHGDAGILGRRSGGCFPQTSIASTEISFRDFQAHGLCGGLFFGGRLQLSKAVCFLGTLAEEGVGGLDKY